MKKYLLFTFAMVFATSMSAQYYVSASGGYSIGSAGVLMGTKLNTDRTTATNEYGSFGEGLNTQINVGYFFNKTFGVELGVAYLHGNNQVRDSYKMADGIFTEIIDAKAYGRAYGLTASLIYNFNDNIYGKFGVATKLGGRTAADFTRTNSTPFGDIVSVGEQDFHGRPPLGFIAALGYKFKLNDKLNLFAELEYLGINVTRDNSEFTKLTIDLPAIPANALGAGHPGIPGSTWNLGETPLVHPIFGTFYAPKDIKYVDNLSTTNSDPSISLSEVVPYSSFGINFGITYTFSKKK